MASRITQEDIEKINELYLKIGVKSRVAKMLGFSASTVSKYIIEGYQSKESRAVEKTNIIPKGAAALIERIEDDPTRQCLFEASMLTKEEWDELFEMQKTEIFM